MRKAFAFLLLLVVLCFVLAACHANQRLEAIAPPQIPADTAPSPSAQTLPSVPETVPAATAAAEQTVPVALPTLPEETTAETSEVTEPAASRTEDNRLPVLEAPEMLEGPSHFFDDAAFIGDSISHTLMIHHTRTGDLGDALFFVRGSLGIHNTLNNTMKVFYQGQSLTPWDALAASGVNKVFIMLGTNDIGYYGIDATMEKWVEYLENIRTQCPDIQIYIQALTPMWTGSEKGILNNTNIDLYNQRLEEFAEANDCFYVDVTAYLKDQTNGMARPYTSDHYVHMNYDGTAVWANLLKIYGAEQEKENP